MTVWLCSGTPLQRNHEDRLFLGESAEKVEMSRFLTKLQNQTIIELSTVVENWPNLETLS
jgi:hypothetical protein